MNEAFSLFERIKDSLGIKSSVNLYLQKTGKGSRLKHLSNKRLEVHIDLDQCRTTRDLVFVMAHELTHAKQVKENKEIIYEGINQEDYRSLPREVEADRYGVYFARNLPYKNKVINKNQPKSLFVELMKLTKS